MIECFGVFLRVIALVCIGSQFAAVRTLLPLHRRIGADTALAKAEEVEEASIARFAPRTSRRGITEPWESSLPPQRPDWCFDGHPKRLLSVDSILQAEPGRGSEPVRGGVETPLRYWSPRHVPLPAVTQMGQTPQPAGAECIGANHLFARLVLHQVRPGDRSAAAAKPRIGSSHTLDSGSVPGTGSSFLLRSGQSVITAPAASLDPLPASIETLFGELARRRLRRLAAKERPS